MARGLLALVAGIALAWAVSSCESGGGGTVAQQAATATGGTAAGTPTATAPERERTATFDTPTVTQPQRTITETETVTEPTRTVTQPARTVTQTQTVTESSTVGAVAVVPTTTPAPPSETTGDEFPWWGMVLILLAVGGALYGIFELGRRHSAGEQPPAP